MTDAEFERFMGGYLKKRGKLLPSDWAKDGLEKAKAQGITDGTRPQAFATREEVAQMIMNK